MNEDEGSGYGDGMSDAIQLEDVKTFAAGLSPWAHLASVGADGKPDVVPVHPCWEGDICWVMIGTDSTKARNVAAHADVAMHWQVEAIGDGVEIWGTAEVFTDLETKRRLWTGVFDYDLNAFAPGGPDGSPDTAFLAITVERALILHQYGMGGLQRWSAG
jgi:general stress protein 26